MVSNLPKSFSGNHPPGGIEGANLPKNFTPDMAKGQEAVQAGPRKPEVTRGEIAEFFARRMVELRDREKGESVRPWLFAIEFPFPDFEYDVAHAYARLLGATLHQGGDAPTIAEPAQPLIMLGRAIAGPLDIERFFHYINHGNDVHILCTRAWLLPQPARPGRRGLACAALRPGQLRRRLYGLLRTGSAARVAGRRVLGGQCRTPGLPAQQPGSTG